MCATLSSVFDGAPVRSLGKDEALFLTGAPVTAMYLVVTGALDLLRHTQSGTRLLLFRGQGGAILAEASAYSDAYHCDGVAAGPAQVRVISRALFRSRLDSDPGLAAEWAARLAHGLQAARMNAAIRTMRTVEERLDAWLAGGQNVPPKGQLQALAESLGVSREALYRELARRKVANGTDQRPC